MIASVYFAKNADEIWAFEGDYDEIPEAGSERTILFSAENPECPVAILHGPAKEPLREVCEQKGAPPAAVKAELDKLHRHVMTQLRRCGIPDVERAEIRLFIHFGAQSRPVLENVNKIFADCPKPANFQCFSVSRYNGIPEELYRGDTITPPRTEEKIRNMCAEIGRGGDHSGGDRIRALIVLCQAVATLPEAKRAEYLQGPEARKWWRECFPGQEKSARSPAVQAVVDGDPRLKRLLGEIEKPDGEAENAFDISDLDLALTAEIAAQKLQGYKL